MRKITQEICSAFEGNYTKTIGNSYTDGFGLFLHGNKIAQHTSEGLMITLAGWNSNTTRERLNCLTGVRVNTKLGQAYLNGKEWDGDWILVK